MAIIYLSSTGEYIGLSTDDKTTTGANISYAGHIIYYTDTKTKEIHNGTGWVAYSENQDVISAIEVPTANSADNVNIADVIGNKTDTIAGNSLISLAKQILTAIAVNFNILTGTTANTNTVKREAGRTQVFTKAITSAANAGTVILGTATSQAVMIKSVALLSNGVTTVDLTSVAIKCGEAGVQELISAVTGAKANIDVEDEQVSYVGATLLPATETIIADIQGTGITPVDLVLVVEYFSTVDGGYLI